MLKINTFLNFSINLWRILIIFYAKINKKEISGTPLSFSIDDLHRVLECPQSLIYCSILVMSKALKTQTWGSEERLNEKNEAEG